MSGGTSSKTDKVRVAFVGAGTWANTVHYPSLASLEDVQVAAVCDLDQGRLHETADTYSIEGRFTDYRKMIEQTAPDGVYVVGPPHHMFDIWMWCLSHGVNLFIEKPMGLTWHQAQMLAELVEVKGVITQVGHQRRSAPLLQDMRRRCLERGAITHAVCEFYKCDMSPQYSASDHLHDDCTHSVDTVRWMCGGAVTDVESRCKRVGTPDVNWVMATLHFDSGSTGVVLNSWSSGRRVFRVQMHAPGVYVDAEVEGKAYLYADGDYEGVEYDTRRVAGSEELFVFGGFQQKSREFIDSLKRGEELTSSPFRETLETMRIVERIVAGTV